MLSDLRFAFRQLGKAPGFSLTIIVTLALAIGACTAIYSALDRIVLRPYDDPETARNVWLRATHPSQTATLGLAYADFLDFEREATSFEMMTYYGGGYFHVTGTGEPVRLRRNIVTPRYFEVHGVKMGLGRVFRPEEFISGQDRVVILGHACWKRSFGGDTQIIGRKLLIDDTPYTVVGVTPESFERSGNINDAWIPRPPDWRPPDNPDPRSGRGAGWITVGRLQRGVSMEQAQAELNTLAAALAEKYPETNRNYGVIILPPGTDAMRRVTTMVQLLFGAVACLILIACANIANLLLVRASTRQKELSVRAALGASRSRLIRQMLTENIVMALMGGGAGVLFAYWALDIIKGAVPTGSFALVTTDLARLAYVDLDRGVLAFALGLSLFTAIVFGLVPAWLSSRTDLNDALKHGTRGSTEGRSRGRFRATLIVLQIAMTITLLACTGLLVRSFIEISAYDPGYDPKQAGFTRVALRGTFAAGRAIEAQLYKTSSSDPIALLGMTLFFAAVAALACWLPARRATNVDPIVALRAE